MPELANRRLSWFSALESGQKQSSRGRLYAIGAVAVLRSAVENFLANDDLLRAAALTYTVALSIVPILALGFSALKGFGNADQIRPLVDRYLAPGSPETANQ